MNAVVKMYLLTGAAVVLTAVNGFAQNTDAWQTSQKQLKEKFNTEITAIELAQAQGDWEKARELSQKLHDDLHKRVETFRTNPALMRSETPAVVNWFLHNSYFLCRAKYELGYTHYLVNKYAEADRFYGEALTGYDKVLAELNKQRRGVPNTQLWERPRDDCLRDKLVSLINRGKNCELMGEPQRAKKYFLEAKALVDNNTYRDRDMHQPYVLEVLSWHFHQQGRKNKTALADAKRHIEDAYKLREKRRASLKEYVAFLQKKLSLVRNAADIQQTKAELSRYQNALRTEEILFARCSSNFGNILFSSQQFAEAEQKLNESLEVMRQATQGIDPEVAVIQNNLACLYRAMGGGRLREAEQLALQSLETFKQARGDNHPETAVAHNTVAWVHAVQGKLSDAVKEMDASRQALRNHASSVLSEQSEAQQLDFLHNKNEHWFHAALSLGFHQRSANTPAAQEAVEKSAEWLLNGKGLLYDVLAERFRLQRAQKIPEAQPIIQELKEVRQKLVSRTAEALFDSAALRKRQTEIQQLTDRENALARDLARILSQTSILASGVALDKLRGQLPADSVLIEIARFNVADFTAPAAEWQFNDTRYAAWIIPPAGKGEVRIVDLGPEQPIKEAVDAFLKEMKNAVGEKGTVETLGFRQSEQLAIAKLDDLSQRVLAPLVPYIDKSSHWIISPDGDLWNIPWQALRYQEDYAVMKKYISLVMSGRQLSPAGRQVRAENCVVFAGIDYGGKFSNLDWSLSEGVSIAKNLKKFFQVDVKTGKAATKDAFLELTNPRVLVLSTHGFFKAEKKTEQFSNPFRSSGLAFAPDRTQAGIVLASEILDMDLRSTSLVVLSACETALGEIRGGEGTASLPYAFQLAGARAVVATLWEVPDIDTALINSSFFRKLVQGEDAVTALCEAQRERIRARRQGPGRDAHPLYWAALSYIGATETLK